MHPPLLRRRLVGVALAIGLAAALAWTGAAPQTALLVLVGGTAIAFAAAGWIDVDPLAAPAETAPTDDADLQAFLSAVRHPALVIEGGIVQIANEEAERLLGGHVAGQDARVALRHPAAAERLSRSDDGSGAAPVTLVGLGQRDQIWEMQVAPLDATRRLALLIDQTGRHAAERTRVDFVANASHELRTPLAAILGFVETLQDDNAGGEAGTRQRFLGVIFAEARRMQQLIEDLMSLSRIEADKYRLPSTVIDLVGLVREVCAEIRASDDPRAMDLGVVAAIDRLNVTGDRPQLSQLVHNLVGNAMKYGRSGTPVEIVLDTGAGGLAQMAVRDEGEGIAPEHLPRLTERFYRVDPGRSRAIGGTGLGLAIVKHIVERHRGRFDIRSTPGQGTVVTVLLPTIAS